MWAIRSVLWGQFRLALLHSARRHLFNSHWHACILNLTYHSLSILCLFRVLLIQNVLILAHTLRLGDTVLLALLVPAPLVDLGLSEVCLCCYEEQLLFRPVRFGIKFTRQLLELCHSLPFALADHSLHLATSLIEHIATSL